MACPPTPSLADRMEQARQAIWAGNLYRADLILRELIREERQDGLGDRGA